LLRGALCDGRTLDVSARQQGVVKGPRALAALFKEE
jgi:hypothetical protein